MDEKKKKKKKKCKIKTLNITKIIPYTPFEVNIFKKF